MAKKSTAFEHESLGQPDSDVCSMPPSPQFDSNSSKDTQTSFGQQQTQARASFEQYKVRAPHQPSFEMCQQHQQPEVQNKSSDFEGLIDLNTIRQEQTKNLTHKQQQEKERGQVGSNLIQTNESPDNLWASAVQPRVTQGIPLSSMHINGFSPQSSTPSPNKRQHDGRHRRSNQSPKPTQHHRKAQRRLTLRNLQLVSLLMVLTITQAQPNPYVLGKPNSAFYFPSGQTPSSFPSQCVEWDISPTDLCYCTDQVLPESDSFMMIDPATIFPSYYIRTWYGEWFQNSEPGPFQELLEVTFEDMFNLPVQVKGTAGFNSIIQHTQDFLPWELNNSVGWINAGPPSIKRWYFSGPQIAGTPLKWGGDVGSFLTNSNCLYLPSGPIIGIKAYLDVTDYVCGVAFAYNKCSCIQQLFQLSDYSLKTMTWATGDPPKSLAWTIKNDLQGMTSYVNTNCGDFLLEPVTSSINGYTPVSLVTDGYLTSTVGNPSSITLTGTNVSGTFNVLLQVHNPSGYTIPGDPTIYHATPLYFYVTVTTTFTPPPPPPGSELCTIPFGSLNLLNTYASPAQSAFSAGYNIVANVGCNGISESTANAELVVTSPDLSPIHSWYVMFAQTVSINTLLLIGPEAPNISNLPKTTASIGSTPDFQTNKICLFEGQILDGGWYECAGSGTYLALWSLTNPITFHELMAYSSFAIQWNSIAQIWTTVLGDPNYPAANVLSKTVVENDSDVARQKCIASLPGTASSGALSFWLKAQHRVKAVVLVPGRNAAWIANQQGVTVSVTDVTQTVSTCGTITDYNTYSEQVCSKSGYLVTLSRSAANVQISLCSVGILSDCKCAQSSFESALIHPFPNTDKILSTNFVNVTLPVTQSTTIAINSQIPDTVSSVCGNADGVSFCGDRVISFTDAATGKAITAWPFKDFSFVSDSLIFDPIIAQTTVIKVTVSLASNPQIQKTEVFTAVVNQAQGAWSIPDQQIFATVNITHKISLPALKPTYTYFILSPQDFQTEVNGNLFAMLSTQKTHEGKTFNVLMSAVSSDPKEPTSFFKVVVKFAITTKYGDLQSSQAQIAKYPKNSKPNKKPAAKSTPVNVTLNATNGTNSTNQTAENKNDYSQMNCTTDVNGNLQICVSKNDPRFTCQPAENGEVVCGYDLKIEKTNATSQAEPPTMVISEINKYGVFYLTFSEPMNLNSLVHSLCGGFINGKLSERTDIKSARFQKLLNTTDANCSATNGTDRKGGGRSPRYDAEATATNGTDFTRNRYLLNSTHLNITLLSGGDQDDSKQQFEWFALNITETQIKIQVIFEYPKFISTDFRHPDKLSIQLLQQTLPVFRTKETRRNIKEPLRTESKLIPPQMKLDSTTAMIAAALESLATVTMGTVIGNLSLNIFLNYVLSRLYTMINALQMTMATCRLNVAAPAILYLIATKINDIAQFNLLPSDQIIGFFLVFSTSGLPNAGFQAMGTQSMRLTLYLGSIFIAMVLIVAMSLFYGITYPCRRLDRTLGRLHKRMKTNYYWTGIIRLIIEAFFDICTGIMLSLNDIRFETGSDVFDLLLTGFFVCLVLASPLSVYLLLRKYEKQLDGPEFQTKFGSLTAGYYTTGSLGISRTKTIVVWYFLRRIFTAVVIVQMAGLTPWLLITVNMYFALADALFNWQYLACESYLDGIVVTFNNFVVLVFSYFPYLYAGLITDPEARHLAGWAQASLLILMIVVNLIVFGYTMFVYIKEQVRRSQVERHNLRVLTRLGYKVVLVGMTPWRMALRFCQLDWLCFDEVPRINVQIAGQVREVREWLAAQINALNRYATAKLQEILNQEPRLVALRPPNNQVVPNNLPQQEEQKLPEMKSRKRQEIVPKQIESQLKEDQEQRSEMSFGQIEIQSDQLGDFENNNFEQKPLEKKFEEVRNVQMLSVERQIADIENRNQATKKLIQDLEAQQQHANRQGRKEKKIVGSQAFRELDFDW